MTTTEAMAMKRTELQAAACRQFGKGAAAWTGRATNEELREALTSGEVPAKFANGNGSQSDLAVAIAAAISALIQSQLDEERVRELIDATMADVTSLIEARLAERATVKLDGATLDRFVFVFWEIDEDYEVFVAGDDQEQWIHYVQKCRRAAATTGITENVVFTSAAASSVAFGWNRRCCGAASAPRTARR